MLSHTWKCSAGKKDLEHHKKQHYSQPALRQMCPLQIDVWCVLPLLRLLKLHDLVFNERRWCDWEQDGWSHFLHKCIATGIKCWRESGKSLMSLHLLLFCFIPFLNKDIGGNTQGAGWGWNQLDQTGSCYREGGRWGRRRRRMWGGWGGGGGGGGDEIK